MVQASFCTPASWLSKYVLFSYPFMQHGSECRMSTMHLYWEIASLPAIPTLSEEEEEEEITSFGQPTKLITCANHGNTVIYS